MNISANMKPEVVLVVAVAANGVIGMTGAPLASTPGSRQSKGDYHGKAIDHGTKNL